MGKRSDFKRRPQDAYQTIDPRAVAALLPHLSAVNTFAEPCVGQGKLMHWLIMLADLHVVMANDVCLMDGKDALTVTDFKNADAIITNPPWTRVLLHAMILHFQKHLPTWLLFDSDWAFNVHAAPYLGCCSDIVAVGRLKWIEGSKHSGKDNVSWYRFWHGHSGGPHFHGRSTK